MLLIKQNRFLPPILPPAPAEQVALGGQWGSSWASTGPGTVSISADGFTATLASATVNQDSDVTFAMTEALLGAGKWYVELDVPTSLNFSARFGITNAKDAATYVSVEPWHGQIHYSTVSGDATVAYPSGNAGQGPRGIEGTDRTAVNYASNGGTAAIAVDLDRLQFWYRPTPITPWSGLRSGDGDPALGLYGLPIGSLVFPIGVFVATKSGAFSARLRSGGAGVAFVGQPPIGFQPGWPQASL